MEKLGYFVLGLIEKLKRLFGRITAKQWKCAGIAAAVVAVAGLAAFILLNLDANRLKSERAFVTELNIILRERETHYETPDDFARVLEILEENGYTARQLQRSGEYTLLWSQTDNRFVLADKTGKIVAPNARPDNFTGRTLEDGAVYIAPVDDTGDFKWKTENVHYALTQDIIGDVVLASPLQLDLNEYTVHGSVVVQHDETHGTILTDGCITGTILIDTPKAEYRHTGTANEVAVLRSTAYTEDGAVYGPATIYAGSLHLTKNARTLLAVGTGDSCIVTVEGTGWSRATGLSPTGAEDPADAARACLQAGITLENAARLLADNGMNEDVLSALSAYRTGTESVQTGGYDVSVQEENGAARFTVTGETGAVFTLETYEEQVGSEHTFSAHVQREESGRAVSVATGVYSSGANGGSVCTFTNSDDVTTLLLSDENGGLVETSGVITGIETHDITFAQGAVQSPQVTVTFADGTRTQEYPGLVWRSRNSSVAAVLGGKISAGSLGETSITVRAGYREAQVQVQVLETKAMIGADHYISLSTALEAAQPGDTITLTADNSETVTVIKPVTIAAAGYEPGEILCPDNMVMSEMMDTYSYNGRVTAHVYGAIGDATTIVDDTVTGTLSQVIETLTSLNYQYNTLHFELYLSGDYALEEDVMLPVRVGSATSFVIADDTTFDLNGHVISQEPIASTGGSRPVFRVEAGTLRITDHKKLGKINACQTVAQVLAGASLDMENVAVTHQVGGVVTLFGNAGNISMQGCTVTTTSDGMYLLVGESGSSLELADNTFLSQSGEINVSGSMELAVHSGRFTGVNISLDSGNIRVENMETDNGLFTGDGDIHIVNMTSSGRVRAETGFLEIDDGTFSGPVYGSRVLIHTGRFNGLVYGTTETLLESGTYNSALYLKGTSEILDGTFTSCLYLYGDTDIRGGNFRNIVYSYEEDHTLTIWDGYFPNYLDAYYGTIEIRGGTFYELSTNDGEICIYSGTFRKKGFEQYLQPGCTYTEKDENGKTVYVVTSE